MIGPVVAEILARDEAAGKAMPAYQMPSNLPDAIRRDLMARPVPAGARRVYNKAFKMPGKAKGDATK